MGTEWRVLNNLYTYTNTHIGTVVFIKKTDGRHIKSSRSGFDITPEIERVYGLLNHMKETVISSRFTTC